MSKSELVAKAIRARDAYEYSFRHDYPTCTINRKEREYERSLQLLVDNGYSDARDYVAHFYDVAPLEG